MKRVHLFFAVLLTLVVSSWAFATDPVVDGKLDASYAFFKQISLEDDHVPPRPATRGVLYKFEDCSYLYLAYVESRAVNDNVYSPTDANTAYAGWVPGPGHTFSDLIKSDKLQLKITTVFDATLDYLFSQGAVWKSGIRAATPTATYYDGTNPASVVGLGGLIAMKTSLQYDVNFCFSGTPPTDSPQPEATETCWEYRIIYEMKFDKSALGLGCTVPAADVDVPLVHNSPAKGIIGITGFKFRDDDCDGAWDPGEPGLSGWNICLDGPGTCVDQCTYTNAQGYYEFYKRPCANTQGSFQLPTGTYSLAEDPMDGYTPCSYPGPFSLASREVVVQKNFGNMKLPACPLPSTTPPVVDGLLDDSYQFFKQMDGIVSGKEFHGVLYKFETCANVWFAYVESRGVNDNVFDPTKANTAYAGWSPGPGHEFDDLLGSDRLELTLIDPGSATIKFHAELDYIFADTTLAGPTVSWLSGIKTSAAGHEFLKYDGTNPASVTGLSGLKAVMTSLQYDVNVCDVALLPGHSNSSPQPEPDVNGCWEYRIIYEMKFSKADLGLASCTMFSDPAKVQVPGVHNSPNKGLIAITGFKFCDENGDCIWDPSEVGLSGWTINLTRTTTPSIAGVNQSTTTNTQGYYEFYLRTSASAQGSYLLPTGDYTVSETVMGGFTQTCPASPGTYSESFPENKSWRVGRNFGNQPGGPPKIGTGGSGGGGEVEGVPTAYRLFQNYPNPFNPTTTIRFAVPEPSRVRLSVYNVLGQELARLVDRDLEAGFQQVEWNYGNTLGLSAASGVYFYRMIATSGKTGNQFIDTKKMLLIK